MTTKGPAAAAIATLVVDDDFRVAELHATYVKAVEGFTVTGVAHTAAQARQQIRELNPDLVLLDLYLPDLPGLSLLRQVTDEGDAHPDFIVISAARDMASIRTAMKLGAVHYLVKPFGFARLKDRLAAYGEMVRRSAHLKEAGQEDVDRLYGLMRAPAAGSLPKGHSAPTMARILDAIRHADGDLSAVDVAEATGISRPTAQRYLSLLVRDGTLILQLRYGTTGRPEHRYSLPN